MSKESMSLVITQFLKKAIELELIHPTDEIYLRNRLLTYLELEEYSDLKDTSEGPNLLDNLDKMVEYVIRNKIIDDNTHSIDIFEAKIMNLITPLPSLVNEKFWDKYEDDKELATDYFYTLSQQNNYIKTRSISKNIFFKTKSPYGDFEITINLSKPEKDPKKIAEATQKKSLSYPKCALCMENEGYSGHSGHAARENHRMIRLEVNNDIYGMQYSPYVYYNEHSIFLNERHKHMVINRQTIENLLEIIDILPHYFVGSNADLPIVGGSILSHDHYQGGHYTFPIEKARVLRKIDLLQHPNVSASIIDWPLSVIRLQAKSREDMTNAVEKIMDTWINYSDESNHIKSHTEGKRHNTITPIARFKEDFYEMDVVLRNNRTNPEYPEGIFHPHPDVHHIKKENIGLIEVMGLAVLPPRLVEELKLIEQYLLDELRLNDVPEIHQNWAVHLKEKKNNFTKDGVSAFLQQEIGNVFTRVLEDAGVFKESQVGMQGFKDFIDGLNH